MVLNTYQTLCCETVMSQHYAINQIWLDDDVTEGQVRAINTEENLNEPVDIFIRSTEKKLSAMEVLFLHAPPPPTPQLAWQSVFVPLKSKDFNLTLFFPHSIFHIFF